MEIVRFPLSERNLVFPSLLRHNMVRLVCISCNCMVWSQWHLAYHCKQYIVLLQVFLLGTCNNSHSNLWNLQVV